MDGRTLLELELNLLETLEVMAYVELNLLGMLELMTMLDLLDLTVPLDLTHMEEYQLDNLYMEAPQEHSAQVV